MIDQLMNSVRGQVKHRVWVLSDLQQSDPAQARRSMTIAVNDFMILGLPCEQIWYLGDAVEGEDLNKLREMSQMQQEMLLKLQAPLRYVTGNHDYDYVRQRGVAGEWPAPPFWETVKRTRGWRTTQGPSDFYFFDELGEYRVVFFSDHMDAAGVWVATHGIVHGEPSAYPHRREHYEAVREVIARDNRPTITCGHYPFAGGNRPSASMNQVLPLPENVRIHFYGHAHIGDRTWAGKDAFRKISGLDDGKIPQIDVASLESGRGSETRSVIFEIYQDETFGVWFRDHERGVWAEGYAVSRDRWR